MSSRVQKGGPVFRPVVKSRSRIVPSTPRQVSVCAVAAESQNDNIGPSTESFITPPISTSQPDIEPSGYATGHIESPIMMDRSNSIPIVNTTSSRFSLPPPVISSSSSNNLISPAPPLPAAETRNDQASGLVSHPSPRPRKRVPSPPPYDPDADSGEDIDPTAVTMAALCADTGQGRVSRKAAEVLTNHATWKAKNREKRAHMRTLMELTKHGREEEEYEHNQDDSAQIQSVGEAASMSIAGTSNAPVTSPTLDDAGNGFDYSQGLATSRYNVQVRIGPNGETVIDEESLVVDRVENDGTDDYIHVVESDHTKFVNSGTYGKRYRGSRWSAEETELFYDALSQYGENYELIAYVLPGRDRKSCKNKFKAEDKRNHMRINHCLNNSIPVDMTKLARMTGKDFSGPIPEIRASSHSIPIPTAAPSQEDTDITARQHMRKRSRSKSQGGVIENGVVVVGDADTFQG